MRVPERASHEVLCAFSVIEEGLVRVVDPATPGLCPVFALSAAGKHVGVDFLLQREKGALQFRRVDVKTGRRDPEQVVVGGGGRRWWQEGGALRADRSQGSRDRLAAAWTGCACRVD